jgi:hypothetical protein
VGGKEWVGEIIGNEDKVLQVDYPKLTMPEIL